MMLASFFIINFSLNDVFADEKKITTQSFSFENTTIIEFTNGGFEEINTIKIWLANDSPTLFKSENGWTSTINSQNMMIFTTLDSLKQNEIVKFGIISDNPHPFFQWEILDNDGNSFDAGQTQSSSALSSTITNEPESIKEISGILSESTFMIVPKSIHPGSTIRIIGDHFIPNSILKLYLDDTLLQSFKTNDNGYFAFTTKIPTKTKIGPMDFILTDTQGNEKIIHVNLTETKQKVLKNTDLSVFEIQDEFFRSDKLEFSGVANPNSSLTLQISNPLGTLLLTKIVSVDPQGHWSALINIPSDAPLDTYSAKITDGKNTVSQFWDVVLSKKIRILPIKPMFQSGELIKFNGTANSNEQINIKFVDPQGNEILSNHFIVNPSGYFEIEYLTSSLSSDGTYVLYAFQEHESEIVFVGLNEYPKKILSAKLNNVNFSYGDMAIIGITGEPFQDLTFSIISANNNEKFNDQISLGPDGKRNYVLNLNSFFPGVYTMIVSLASSQVSEVFTVGFEPSSTSIKFDIIDKTYNPGQTIFVSGKSEPNSTLILLLIDPDGIVVGEKETFVNNNGDLSIANFVVPYDAMSGRWIIRAEGVPTFTDFNFQVNSLEKNELRVSVIDINYSSSGTFVTIGGFSTVEERVKITIEDSNGNSIFQTNLRTAESGEFNLLWKVPSEHVSGTYSVIVENSFGKTNSVIFDL